MPFSSLKDLLPQAVRQAGLHVTIDATNIVGVAQDVLGELLPPLQARFIQPVSFAGGVLRVTIAAPSAAHAIRLHARAWMETINVRVGRKIVTEIVVRRQGF